MDARLAKADAAFLLPRSHQADRHDALRLAAGRAFDASLVRGLAQLADTLLGWPERARVRQELAALTDRELADIGLSRGEIGQVAAGQLSRPSF